MTVIRKYNYQHDYSRICPKPMCDRVMHEQKARKESPYLILPN